MNGLISSIRSRAVAMHHDQRGLPLQYTAPAIKYTDSRQIKTLLSYHKVVRVYQHEHQYIYELENGQKIYTFVPPHKPDPFVLYS